MLSSYCHLPYLCMTVAVNGEEALDRKCLDLDDSEGRQKSARQ